MKTSRSFALVADDDEFFRIAITSILTRELGFKSVAQAGSLDEGLEILGTQKNLELALFDLAMPGMDSTANLPAIRECAPNVLAAVVSASTDRRHILSALGAGVHGYIPKSLGPSELVRALEMILGGGIFVPPSLAVIPIQRKIRAAGERGQAIHGERGQSALTPRRLEVLNLLVDGRSNREIASLLTLSEGTVKIHMAALFRTLGVQNRAAAAVAGARMKKEGPLSASLRPVIDSAN
jgi:DNA-binding NarL/FixJ family response regulator